MIDDDGFLTITDRKKEIIIASAGKNISPARIENFMRAHPWWRRPWRSVTAARTSPPSWCWTRRWCTAWARARGIDAPALAALAVDPAVVAEIQAAVDAANTKLARPEQVKTFRILPVAWTAESGELTPKLSMRRRIIGERYAQVIDEMYAASTSAR